MLAQSTNTKPPTRRGTSSKDSRARAKPSLPNLSVLSSAPEVHNIHHPQRYELIVAPQKMAYMADSYWKSTGNKYSSSFISGMPTMFAVPHYSKALDAIRQEKGISGTFNTNLVEVRPDSKTAIFEVLSGEDKGKKIEKEFGLLHVVPPMGPLDTIKNSPLADTAGWVNVDQGSLQHKKYENVFSLGDASSLPTSKVGLHQEVELTCRLPLLSLDRLLCLPTTSHHI